MASDVKNTGMNIVFRIMRILLGLFFLTTGVLKLFHLDTFIDDVARFDLFPPDWEMWIAYLGIGCELVVAYCFLTRALYAASVWLATAMCSVFVIIFVQGWIRGLSLSCSCVGVERAVKSYPFEVGWRLLLLLAVMSLLWEIRKNSNVFSVFGRLGLDRNI